MQANTPLRQLILLAALAMAAGSLQAQGDPGMTSRGQPTRVERDSAYARVVATLHEGRFSYVRIETREPGAPLNQHPVSIDAVALRALLARVQLPGSKNEPLFNKDELDEIVPPLVQALARATPEQDVSFSVSGQHGVLGPLALRLATTARVFFADGSMNLIFGLVRRDVEAQYRATGYQMALEPGKRSAAVDRSVKLAAAPGATNRRADWLVLDPQAKAPATAAAPALPTPALVVPAPSAAPAAAPAPAPAASSAPAPAPAASSAPAPVPAPAPAPAAAVPPAAAATAAPTAASAAAPVAPAASFPPPPATVAPPPPRTAPAPDAEAMYRNVAERLKVLQKLRDTGVITEQEYQEKRREILKAL
jgi:hypothetical protein